MIFQALADFVLELSENGIQQRRRLRLDFGGMDQLLVKETGEQHAQQIHRDGRDGAFGRQIFAVQMIDAADARIRRDQLIRELRDRFHGEGFTTTQRRNQDFVGRGGTGWQTRERRCPAGGLR